MEIRIDAAPLRPRPLVGLGAETDVFLHGEVPERHGVNEEDHKLIERRLRALAPSIARLFVWVDDFNPSLDGRTFTWNHPRWLAIVRTLRVLQEIGCTANLVLFQPFHIPTAALPPVVDAMVESLAHLRDAQAITNVGYLTLFNEPESYFTHDSPLARKIFGPAAINARHTWADYVALNRRAHARLVERSLFPRTRLAVCDSAWGGMMRRERMTLAARDFADLPVTYSYHHYNPEDPAFYKEAPPEFAYEGAFAEAARFRTLVGPDTPLVVWECNNAGQGFGTHFMGVGPHGEEVAGSPTSGSELADKVIKMLNGGADGLCLWHLTDFPFGLGTNRFGLWRFKHEGWLPRPYYHAFAALCRDLRPGALVLGTHGTEAPVAALAVRDGKRNVVVLSHHDPGSREVTLRLPCEARGQLLRLAPGRLPATADLPFDQSQPTAPVPGADPRTLTLRLEPWDVTLWTSQA